MKYIDEYHPRSCSEGLYYNEVAAKVTVPDKPAYLIQTIGLARTGSTASLNFMASSNVRLPDGTTRPIKAAYQHLKAGFRQAMHDWPNPSWSFEMPQFTEHPVFYGKDPLGPYTDIESRFNPLEILERTPLARGNIFLSFLLREPTEVLTSWRRNWGGVRDTNVLRQNLITSFHSLRQIYEQSV